MSNDGFMDKAGEAAAKIFGGQEQRYKGGAYADDGKKRSAQAYPMGGDAVEAGTGPHSGARTEETRVGGAVAGDRGQYQDDPHYQETRAAHLDEFDRDYDAYRREHGSADRPQSDFGTWRETRRGQREATHGEDASSRALGESPNQGSDGPHVLDRSFSGTYDKD